MCNGIFQWHAFRTILQVHGQTAPPHTYSGPPLRIPGIFRGPIIAKLFAPIKVIHGPDQKRPLQNNGAPKSANLHFDGKVGPFKWTQILLQVYATMNQPQKKPKDVTIPQTAGLQPAFGSFNLL